MSQIALTLPAEPSFAAEDYMVYASNREAWNALMCWPNWPDYAIWLYGPGKSGKSHLASIWAQRAQAKQLNEADWASSLRDPHEAQSYFIDPLPEVMTQSQQAALFHLLNHVKNTRSHLLIVCEHSPKKTAVSLPDLRSRLLALPSPALHAPDDDLLRAVWFKRFADKQLQVAPPVIDYLLSRSERSFIAIHQSVEQLDRAALEQQRAITVPLAKEVLRHAG